MSPNVELIYFEGCPNAGVARENVRAALVAAGLPPTWQEHDQEAPDAPPHAKQHGSPTVLVDGRDVTGEAAGVTAAACRADGAPSVDVIQSALSGTA